jgi:pantoate--beta-alanine ligase
MSDLKVLRNLQEMEAFKLAHRDQVAFVPTMGNLHEGHLTLIDEAQKRSPVILASIFVNPTQFNDPKDFSQYPKTLEADLKALEKRGASAVFLPSERDIYPDSYRFRMTENLFSKNLCGSHRPGHFDGVLTVVLKLLNLTGARWLILGLKDFQQYSLLRDMCQALFLPVEVVGVETRREADGLAMSSRNGLLSPEERAKAPRLFQVLSDFSRSDSDCRTLLESEGFEVDYFESRGDRRFVAARIGTTRLIDNVKLQPKVQPFKNGIL